MSKRRMGSTIVGAGMLALAALAPAGAAGAPGSIAIVSPASGSAVGRDVQIVWAYATGTVITASSVVRAEVKLGGPVYTLIGEEPITAGSMPWDTSALVEGSGYQLRLTVMGTNKQAIADSLVLDNTSPHIDVSVDPSMCTAWCNGALATVTVTASDASGLAQDPSGVTELADEGVHELTFVATDVVGNSATASVTVRIDRTAPVLTAVVEPVACVAPSWCNAAEAVIDLSASDDASGITADPSGLYPVTDEGVQARTFEVADVAGNTASVTVTLQLDRTAPVTAIDPADVPLVLNALDGAVTGTATDVYSGVASTSVTFTDALGNVTARAAECAGCGTTEATWSVSTADLLPGLYSVAASSIDVAGNVGAASAPVMLLIA